MFEQNRTFRVALRGGIHRKLFERIKVSIPAKLCEPPVVCCKDRFDRCGVESPILMGRKNLRKTHGAHQNTIFHFKFAQNRKKLHAKAQDATDKDDDYLRKYICWLRLVCIVSLSPEVAPDEVARECFQQISVHSAVDELLASCGSKEDVLAADGVQSVC